MAIDRGVRKAMGQIDKDLVSFSSLILLFLTGCSAKYTSQRYHAYGPHITYSQVTCPREVYSVVFDAGSTGSRVFVFQFKIHSGGNTNGSVIELSDEFYKAEEPGISSFANNVSEVSIRLEPLLRFAMEKIPRRYRPNTLLTFKATAGLRLLPTEIGEKILDEVRFLMEKSSFHIPDLKSIEVMGGDDEGLFGWLTANFLLGTLWNVIEDKTVNALDLGGGSIQITFSLPSSAYFKTVCAQGVGYVYKINLLKSSFTVFTHSFLGYGLKSAYLQIMGGQEEIESEDIKSKTLHGESWTLSSPCFVPSFALNWTHGRHTHPIRGQEPEVSRLADCKRHVDEFVVSSGLSQYVNLKEQDIYLFSYFYDVAVWAGIIPKENKSTVLTPSDFFAAATHHCHHNEFSEDNPFLCMSVLYIHSLLTVGLGLSEDRCLHVGNEINRKQLSWTLGSALSTLNEQFYYSALCDTS